MFDYFLNVKSIDMRWWDASKVITMENMFQNCNNLVELDLSWWNTRYLQSMKSMFKNCYKLERIDWLSNIKTDNVTDMSFMFLNCNGLRELDLSWWNTRNVSNMKQMFARDQDNAGKSKLETIYVSNKFEVYSYTDQMFWRAVKLKWWNWTTWFGWNWYDSSYAIIDGKYWQPWYFTDASRPRVTFDSKGSYQVLSQAVQPWWYVNRPINDPQIIWWKFVGWFVQWQDVERDFDDPVQKSMILYAKYECRNGYTLNTNMECVLDVEWERSNQIVKDLDLYFIDSTWAVYHKTIMDRNMWAKEAYTWVDNVDTYWYYYQWWNNYWFTYHELKSWLVPVINTQIPYSIWWEYLPSTYATWVFVTHSSNWQAWMENQKRNSNLWWWADDTTVSNWWWTKVDRQWPCPDGYYVPSAYDFVSMINIWNASTNIMDHDKFALDLLLPMAWHVKKEDWTLLWQNGSWFLWSSSQSPAGTNLSYRMAYHGDQFNIWNGMNRSSANPVRCFKNVDNTPIVINPNWWTWSIVSIVENKVIALENPTRNDDQFLWWYTTPNFVRDTNINTWEKSDITWATWLYARWEWDPESYIITFIDEDGTEISSDEYRYWTKAADIVKPHNPSKADDSQYKYEFIGWTPAITDVVWDATYTAVYDAVEIKRWSWWSKLKKDYCPDGDYSDSYYDWDCGISQDLPDDEENKTRGSDWEENNYTDEELSAYEWAYKNGITTKNTMQDANPNGYVLRWHMAKMVVKFVENVLWKWAPKKIPAECLKLNNWTIGWESQEIQWYAMRACAHWIMWIDMMDNNFLANDIVSRAEFGTIVSRILWGNTHNVKHTREIPYYTKHLNELNRNWIITQIDKPLTRKELRKRVWVVLKRISESEINH